HKNYADPQAHAQYHGYEHRASAISRLPPKPIVRRGPHPHRPQEQEQRQPGHRRVPASGMKVDQSLPAASRSAASAASGGSTAPSTLNSSLCSASPCSACLCTATSWPASRGESKPTLWISSWPSPSSSLK